MFDQTFVNTDPSGNKPYTLALSLIVQIGAIGLLILVPLLYTQSLPNAQLKSTLMAPPPPPTPPRPPVTTSARPTTLVRTLQARLLAPVRIPKQIATIAEAPAAPNIGTNAYSTEQGNAGDPLLFSSNGGGVVSPPPPAVSIEKPKQQHGPLRVGGVVAEANIIHKVQPSYPPLAKSARVQGTVEFSAVISKEGRVLNLQLVHGHPLLVAAARDAILQWQYRPTTLNGQSVDVLTTITVNFTLSQ